MCEYERDRRADRVELCLRSIAHALHATCDDNVLVAKLDLLGADDDALEAGRTDLVDGRRVCLFRDACEESGLACRGLAYTGLNDIANEDLLYRGQGHL